jgi:alpha-L-arabinofuranosidase
MDNATGELVLKLVNTTDKPVSPSIKVEGVKKLPARAVQRESIQVALDKTNSLDEPMAVSPKKEDVPFKKGNVVSPVLQPYSVSVVRIAIH